MPRVLAADDGNNNTKSSRSGRSLSNTMPQISANDLDSFNFELEGSPLDLDPSLASLNASPSTSFSSNIASTSTDDKENVVLDEKEKNINEDGGNNDKSNLPSENTLVDTSSNNTSTTTSKLLNDDHPTLDDSKIHDTHDNVKDTSGEDNKKPAPQDAAPAIGEEDTVVEDKAEESVDTTESDIRITTETNAAPKPAATTTEPATTAFKTPIQEANYRMVNYKDPVRSNDPYIVVWEKCRATGWKWKNAKSVGGLESSSYNYFLPNSRNYKQGAEVGVDYVSGEDGVKEFAKRHWGWIEGLAEKEIEEDDRERKKEKEKKEKKDKEKKDKKKLSKPSSSSVAAGGSDALSKLDVSSRPFCIVSTPTITSGMVMSSTSAYATIAYPITGCSKHVYRVKSKVEVKNVKVLHEKTDGIGEPLSTITKEERVGKIVYHEETNRVGLVVSLDGGRLNVWYEGDGEMVKGGRLAEERTGRKEAKTGTTMIFRRLYTLRRLNTPRRLNTLTQCLARLAFQFAAVLRPRFLQAHVAYPSIPNQEEGPPQGPLGLRGLLPLYQRRGHGRWGGGGRG